MDTINRSQLKFADVSLNYWYEGDTKEHTYDSNIWIKRKSEYGRDDYFSPLFHIYSYIGKGRVRIWGLYSPKLEKNRFYNDYETALKWANILYEQMEIKEEVAVHRSFQIKWYTNSGTKKCPVWNEHRKTAFCYSNPAITYG